MIVRMLAYTTANAGLFPASIAERLGSITTFQAWARAIEAHKSVSESYDAATNVESTKERLAKMRN